MIRRLSKDIYQNAGASELLGYVTERKSGEIYHLKMGCISENLYILQDDAEEEDYNADTIIIVWDFPI